MTLNHRMLNNSIIKSSKTRTLPVRVFFDYEKLKGEKSQMTGEKLKEITHTLKKIQLCYDFYCMYLR